jgi:hypothetical protein
MRVCVGIDCAVSAVIGEAYDFDIVGPVTSCEGAAPCCHKDLIVIEIK